MQVAQWMLGLNAPSITNVKTITLNLYAEEYINCKAVNLIRAVADSNNGLLRCFVV